MARYRGPRSKIARKLKSPVFGPDKVFEKKNYPPGQHGPYQRRKKYSEYATQLLEKQKVKYTYGILERQFAKIFDTATRKKGMTGTVLLQLCESRLDNTVFRMSLAPTRAAARQLVSHRHIMVNGRVTNIPSYTLKPGDKISVRHRSRSLEVINNALSSRSKRYDWLDWNSTDMEGTFVDVPEREQIPEDVKEQLIVELYSK